MELVFFAYFAASRDKMGLIMKTVRTMPGQQSLFDSREGAKMRQNTKILFGEMVAMASHQQWGCAVSLKPFSFFAASRLRVRKDDK